MNHLSLGAAMSIAKISLVVTALLASATAANANIITVSAADIGNSYTVDYDGFTEGQVIGGLTGQTTFTLTGATGTSYSFDYTVATTSADPITASRISVFAHRQAPCRARVWQYVET